MPELTLMPDFKAQKIRLKIRRKRNFAAGAPCVTFRGTCENVRRDFSFCP
jgi:hypothetical protein